MLYLKKKRMTQTLITKNEKGFLKVVKTKDAQKYVNELKRKHYFFEVVFYCSGDFAGCIKRFGAAKFLSFIDGYNDFENFVFKQFCGKNL